MRAMRHLKLIAVSLVSMALAIAQANQTTQTLLTDAAANVAPNMTVSGAIGGYTGVQDNGNGNYSLFGTTTFTYSRTNTDTQTHVGYKVTTTVNNPTYPAVANFPNPATVYWLDAGSGGSGEPD